MLIQTRELCICPFAIGAYITPSVFSIYILPVLVALMSLVIDVLLNDTRLTAPRLQMDQLPGE